MPVYESVCLNCGKYHEYIRTVSNCLDTPECCGIKTDKRILSAPMGIVDIPAYESPATGKWITSRSERKEDLKRSGCREWEGMEAEKQEAENRKKYEEEAQDKSLDHVVRQAWADLPPSKKAEALAATV
jgi:predicted nucleic acid-binding Zn ribbon protein